MAGPTVMAQAEALANAGREAEAHALVAAAVARGDPEAVMATAAWKLFGLDGPRDPGAAKALLARAADAGHLPALTLLTRITGNSACGPADWDAAITLLERAAATDTKSRAELTLVRALDRPLPAPERLSDSPNVVRFPGLLSQAECDWLIAAAEPGIAPSLVVDPRSGRPIADPVRRAGAMSFGPLDEDLAVRAIGLRIAAASNTGIDRVEPLAVLRYNPGDEYRPHLDTIPGLANQRAVTVLTYLNDSFDGGATVFSETGLSVAPRTGDAIVFQTLDAAGRPDPMTRHAGAPVTRGTKYLCSRWIRSAAHDIWSQP
ncbi:2OG-Fe(II) oxygenase [Glacieibacterium megasporae]|uniref:2OG-Fe(II) oxygenase n=1 Tax=Glacieibacterium megasporae TaxID=2835787 RepID=UPI001C1E5181|nr:2OG-Fe(II) oxygenase [Polymorphobacter megasporae]UAJ08627.1 2OG-Fe(II) oxygenase [Polymorphobacter megasporae]